MADERTSLVQVVRVRPARARYPHHSLRRVCTVLLSAIPLLVVVACVFALVAPLDEEAAWSAYLPLPRPGIPKAWPEPSAISFQELQKILLTTPDAQKAREWSRYYTSGPHLAGQNLSQALWTKDKWQQFGVYDTTIVDYDVYVNYPHAHRLALLEAPSDGGGGWRVAYEAVLEEDVLDQDGTSALPDRIPTFHGYSASGNATASYVYCNYGTFGDYEQLLAANVSLDGRIALVKYGKVFRGLKVKRAQELGMVGVVMYSDPGDDGNVTEANGFKPYPDGPARNPSSVQRGSTQFLSFAPGDPTTPGYPSKPGVPRQPVDHALPSIPSLPISYADAIPLLRALNGHGPKASAINEQWHGGLEHKGVEYHIGPSPDHLALNLFNDQDYVITPMWNVIGIINGTIADEVVILGNHRDAWVAGGAADPNSGSAAFNEVIRAFGVATRAGWIPLRTIVFASWDGEEYGLIGSTEWVEEQLPWLQEAAVAYLNVDVGTRGPRFIASAAPLLHRVLAKTASMVPSPNQTVLNQTVGDIWDGHISTMGSGSDFTAFQDFAGIPSLDMGFDRSADSPIYHYHSNYDSFDWMDSFGDPGFHYHATVAKMWALVAAHLADSPVVPLNATDYATALSQYIARLKDSATQLGNVDPDKLFRPLESAIARFRDASVSLDGRASSLMDEISDIPWWKWWQKIKLWYAVRRVNTRYKLLERHLLHAPGLDSRPWFKHVVFAPGRWTGYSGATFPGIVEGFEDKDNAQAEKWVGIASRLVAEAAESLM